jgi:hypothetical protein
MNAPLTDAVRQALEKVSLDDKYALPTGRAFMSGVQALVRLPMLQRTRDAMAGLNTAGFISGYRGSPLGGYDQALWQAKKHLQAQHIVFQPGVNEELGATAVWGTQQLDLFPEKAKYDGVFGLWYGKGPGVDRCIDVFKHANMAGTSRFGGVIAIAGDDHVSKSSTAPHQSDHVFKACGFPTFFPSSVQDILDMGLHAWALSRFSGVWTGMKTIQEVVESATTVDVSPDRVKIILPEDFPMPPGGLHIRWPDPPLEQEARLMDHKWYAALAYVRANKLNHNVIEGARPLRHHRQRQGLQRHPPGPGRPGPGRGHLPPAGHPPAQGQRGVAAGGHITREFALGLQEILVVEEKRQIIEYQLKEELYNWRADVRPNVIGKFDEGDDADLSGGEWSRPNPSENWLLRAKADLTPAIIAKAIAKRLKKLGVPEDIARRMDQRVSVIEAKERELAALASTGATTGDRCPGSARAARTTPAPACPRARARWPASAATTWSAGCPPPHRHLHPDGRRGRALGGPGAVHERTAHLHQPGRRHLLPLRPAGHPPEHRRRGEHHLQDPLQRRGGHDRRPARGRAARGPLGAADHDQPALRGRGQAGDRQRRAGQVRPGGPAHRRDGAPPRRAGPHPARVPRAQRHHHHHLRPDLRHREAPPPQARHDGGADTRVVINPWSARAAATAR